MTSNDNKAFTHFRELQFQPEQIFAAIANPDNLKKWWGSAGFTNTFEICEFKVGGIWKYVMHGPHGKEYPNESRFEEIQLNKKVVIRHIALPHYTLEISLTGLESKGKTLVTWIQTFDKPEVAKAIAHIVATANEQNLDKLSEQWKELCR